MPLEGRQYGVIVCRLSVKAYRDLNDPEGWRFSSLRKILLLRFRIPLSQMYGGCARKEVLVCSVEV
jgi:hypothetical protein